MNEFIKSKNMKFATVTSIEEYKGEGEDNNANNGEQNGI